MTYYFNNGKVNSKTLHYLTTESNRLIMFVENNYVPLILFNSTHAHHTNLKDAKTYGTRQVRASRLS